MTAVAADGLAHAPFTESGQWSDSSDGLRHMDIQSLWRS